MRHVLSVLSIATAFLVSVASGVAQSPPVIDSTSARRQTVNAGGRMSFIVMTKSDTPVTYQWKRNGLLIPGATQSAYGMEHAVPARDSGWYQVIVSNAGGSVTSRAMFLNVVLPIPQIVVWGSNQQGQAAVPGGLGGVAAISAGFDHCLALKADGTVVAWGGNGWGQANVPAGLNDVVAIAAGNVRSLALKADGTVVGWGNTVVPIGLSDVVAISADWHNFAVKADGTVVGWGNADFGAATPPTDLKNAIAAAACGSNSLALRADGTVVGWGSNIYGQANVPAGLSGVVQIALSDRGYALKSNRSVVTWGSGINVGQTWMPQSITGVSAISARSIGNLVLMLDGSVRGWGLMTLPERLTQVVAISHGDTHAMALRDASGVTLPSITTQPVAQTVAWGRPATFSVGAATGGTAGLQFQWRKNGVDIVGATAASYAIPSVGIDSAGTYDVEVSNYIGAVTSAAARLTVVAEPIIVAQPTSATSIAGSAATFTVRVSNGVLPTTYQWRKDGINIPGATGAIYTIPWPQMSDAGAYTCVVTNAAGSVTTAPAMLTVLLSARLTNVSVRTTLSAGQTMIVGLVVSGGTKDVLVRAAGPALGQFGLATAMIDPRLELYRGSVKVLENDNWPSVLTGVFADVGAFPFLGNSRDAALLHSMTGSHSAVVSGNGPGVVLVEAYETGVASTARLINVSARNRVGTDADVLIAGFSVAGSGSKTVLIRAAGPALSRAPFSVPDTLGNPKIELYDAKGVKIAENEDWDPSLADVFASVGAFPFALGSKDAAIVARLAAGGGYSAQVKGAAGDSGEALVEVYELP